MKSPNPVRPSYLCQFIQISSRHTSFPKHVKTRCTERSKTIYPPLPCLKASQKGFELCMTLATGQESVIGKIDRWTRVSFMIRVHKLRFFLWKCGTQHSGFTSIRGLAPAFPKSIRSLSQLEVSQSIGELFSQVFQQFGCGDLCWVFSRYFKLPLIKQY